MKHYGDVSKINGAEVEPVDVITAGFPCQSVSVAGKREGLTFENGDYTRSGLVYEAFRIIKEMQEATNNEYPKYLVFENVPGLLSSNKGKDFESILNKIAELGFLADMDILDAQDFGVPQRRKRVYISCVNVEFLMKNGKMPLSESITLQLISELLLNSLGVRLRELEIAPQGLGVAVPLRSTDSLKRTMNTFSLTRESRLKQLQSILEQITAKLENEQELSELKAGSVQTEKTCWTQEVMPLESLGTKEPQFMSTDMSLKECWGESLRQANECITLTATNKTTQKQIYMYVKVLLNTLKYTIQYASLVLQTNPNCKNYYQWVESYLTEARGYINAVKKHNKKNKCVGWNDDVWDFNATLRETEILLERYFTIRRAAKIPPKPDRLHGNPAESGKAGEGVAADAVGSVDGSVGAVGIDGYNFALTGDKAATVGVNCGISTGRNGVIESVDGSVGVEYCCSMITGQQLYAWEDMANPLKARDYKDPAIVAYSFDSLSSNSMKSSNPFSGCRAVEIAKCIDTTYPDPSKNQGGVAVVQPVIALQANGIDRADTVDRHAVCFDRATFNQGINAQYDFEVSEEGVVSTVVAKGPSGVCYDARGNGDGETACFTMQRSDEYQACNVASTQSARQYKSATDLVVEKKRRYIIRRLTPTECARLQGFPDWWSSLAPYNPADAEFWEDVRKTHAEINGKKYKPVKDIKKWYNKLHTDSAEYKAYGNGLALPCAEFVIHGIAEQGAKTLGSLFDGIGGFPLAGVLNGIKPVWASEVECYPIAVTKSRFKEVHNGRNA